MNSVKKAKERLRKYPYLLSECKDPASQYAKCVVAKANIGKDECVNEFMKLKACLVDAAMKNKTRL